MRRFTTGAAAPASGPRPLRNQVRLPLQTVTSLLRNWSPTEPSGEVYRSALATEIGVRRKNRVAADWQLDFASRVDAVRTPQAA